jgi:CRP-like cAMP-binding protein
MSFVDNRPPSATVYALEKSVVLAIPRAALLARLNTDPSFAARFYRALSVFLSDRLRHTVDQLDYSRGKGLGEATNYSDEIGHESLEAFSLAGARFDWVQRRLHAN